MQGSKRPANARRRERERQSSIGWVKRRKQCSLPGAPAPGTAVTLAASSSNTADAAATAPSVATVETAAAVTFAAAATATIATATVPAATTAATTTVPDPTAAKTGANAVEAAKAAAVTNLNFYLTQQKQKQPSNKI